MEIRKNSEETYSILKKKNSDPYGACAIRYMERWAHMMEAEIKENNLTVAAAAEKTNHAADTEGITGFMFGWVVGALYHYWIYGEELRAWHNDKYGYKGTGVVNPAIITIGDK